MSTKNRGAAILPLPAMSRGALVKAEADHVGFAMLEFQSPTSALIAEPAPLSARLTAVFVATLILCFILSTVFIKIDMVVTAPSVVSPHDPLLIVQPLETAIVRKILVHDGEMVKKGQLLAVLDPTFAASDEKSTVAQMESLKAQVDRLKAEMANKTYVSDGTPYSDGQAQMWQERHSNYIAQVASLQQTVDAARAKVAQLNADERGYLARLPLAQTVEDKRSQLAKLGLDSQLNLLAAQDQRLQIDSELDGAIQNLVAFVHQWFSQTSDTLDTQERSLSDMTDQATKNKLRRQEVDMTAAQDAVVNSISHVSIGSVMQSGDELMRLVPTHSALDVVGTIAGADAGYVKVGDPVAIKFDTLPYLIYGWAQGTVRNVSSDSFSNLPAPQSNPLPTQPSLGYSQTQNLPAISPVSYMIRMSIDKLRLQHVPSSFKVMPGMPITADIRVGKRSVLEYLFERMVPAFSEGFREPS
jgi:hemolysin D